MKSRTLTCITASTLFAALAVPVGLAAQDNPHNKHHHYKLVDLSTFGGPQSYVNQPGWFAQVLNDRGTVAGWADTSTPDPYNPNFCFNSDCFISHAFRWQDGDLTDLGVLPSGASSASNSISTNGLIAGVSQNGQTDPLVSGFPEFRAVLWRNDSITDLGTLEGGYESMANAVNSDGVIVGVFTNTTPDPNSIFGLGYQTRAFRWDEKNGMQDLGTLGTGTDAEALLVNRRGEIAGDSYTNSTASAYCKNNIGLSLTTGAFLWKNGTLRDLGNFGGTCTVPSFLSDQGQVLGISTLPGDTAQHPFLWPGKNGTIQDLGTLGGTSTFAAPFGINHGEIVGSANLKGDAAEHAFLWKNGKMRDLGTVDSDQCSEGYGINSKGQVVGTSFGTCFTAPRAFLWQKGGPMVDLNTLIPPGSDLHLEFPGTINDRGEIAGNGSDSNGNEHAFLLIPCDENHPDVDGCDYSLVDASTTAPDRPTPTQRPTTANPWLSGAANPMMRFFGHRPMPRYRKLGVQPPQK
jgi:probable HAF family extracellular repeat protein